MDQSINQLNESIDKIAKQLSSSTNGSENEEKTTDLFKSLAVLYNNRGFIYYKSVEFNLAADDYTTAIKLDPSLAIAYYNRATIHYRMDHFDKALDDMKIAIDLEPNNPEFRLGFEQSSQQINKSIVRNNS